MKKHIKEAAKKVASNPVVRESAKSLKPKPNAWGVLGIFVFFILPEIIGFIWGKEIAQWAHSNTLTEPTEIGRKAYWALEMLFKDGGSWVNIGIGIALMLWLLWDWLKIKKQDIQD